MFTRAYLRASTEDQHADRARAALQDFMADRNRQIASFYIENASGRSTDRPELRRLLDDAGEGDVLLVESIDRLTRLPAQQWRTLRHDIQARGIRIVAMDLPTTHAQLSHPEGPGDAMTARVMGAINEMIVEIASAQAERDYLQRRERQQQGIERAKRQQLYKGRRIDQRLHEQIVALRAAGHSVRDTARLANTTIGTAQRATQRALNNPETPSETVEALKRYTTKATGKTAAQFAAQVRRDATRTAEIEAAFIEKQRALMDADDAPTHNSTKEATR